MKLNLKVTASAFALTAILVLGTAASHATNIGQPATNVKNAAPPQVIDLQTTASALPEDLTVAPDPKLNASVSTLPGGATIVNAVFITAKKNTAVPLLSANLNVNASNTNAVNAHVNAVHLNAVHLNAVHLNAVNLDNNEANLAPAPDLAVAIAKEDAVNAHAIALSSTNRVALASNNSTPNNAGNIKAATHSTAATEEEIAMATPDASNTAANNSNHSTALTPTNEVAMASFNALTNAANNGIANVPRTTLTSDASTAATLTAALTAPNNRSQFGAVNHLNEEATVVNS